MSTEGLVQKHETWNHSGQGKCKADSAVFKKIKEGKPLNKEDWAIWGKADIMGICQCHVLNYVFPEEVIHIKDIRKLIDWCGTDNETLAFQNRRLRGEKGEPLAYGTMHNLARAIVNLAKWMKSEFTHPDLQFIFSKIIDHIAGLARNMHKKQLAVNARSKVINSQTRMVDISDFDCHFRGMWIVQVYGPLLRDNFKTTLGPLHTRKMIVRLQSHMAMTLTLSTGKRPFPIACLKIKHIYAAKEEICEKTNVRVFVVTNQPEHFGQKFKTTYTTILGVRSVIYDLIYILAWLHITCEKVNDDATLLCNALAGSTTSLDTLLKNAWRDAGLSSNITATAVCHTLFNPDNTETAFSR